jgi:hypothetical protein
MSVNFNKYYYLHFMHFNTFYEKGPKGSTGLSNGSMAQKSFKAIMAVAIDIATFGRDETAVTLKSEAAGFAETETTTYRGPEVTTP